MSELDCKRCGACCTDQLILLTPTDKVPLHMQDGGFLRKQMGRCAALMGRVGVNVSCSIYDCRPEICVVMKKGDWACLSIRDDSYLV